MAPSSKARSYCLTINNWTPEHVETLKQEKYKYLLIGNEIAPTTNTPHLQVYISYPNPRSFNAIKNSFPTAHIEIANGTPEQNKAYCSKDDVLFEGGDLPRPGSRSDIAVCRELVQSSNRIRDVVNHATSIQGVRIAELWLKYHESPP